MSLAALLLWLLPLAVDGAATPLAVERGELLVLGEYGARLLLDGRAAGQLPLAEPLLVAPGSHQLILDDRGRQLSASVEVEEGGAVDVRFDKASGAATVAHPPRALLRESHVGADPADLALLTQALRSAMQKEGLRRRDASSPTPADSGCSDEPQCGLASAGRSHLPYALWAKSSHDASGWQLEASLGSSELGELASQKSERCDGCSAAQSAERLQQLARRVIAEGLARPRSQLEVRSEPAGATVTWNGRRLGETPLLRPMYSGGGELVVEQAGYRSERRQLQLEPGRPEKVELALRDATSEPAPAPLILELDSRPSVPRVLRAPRPRWRLATGGIALAGGVGLLSFGIGGLAIDGSCVVAPVAPAQRCDQIYSTGSLGLGLTVAGGLLSIGGAILLALPGARLPPAATSSSAAPATPSPPP